MLTKDACNILGLEGNINSDDIKRAYYAASKKYHPDINPAGLQMMKVINEAYEVLQDFSGQVDTEHTTKAYPEALNEAICKAMTMPGLIIEICGNWLWVSGDTRTHKSELKAAGFRYAPKKQMWYFRPANYKSFNRGTYSINQIRFKYGTTRPEAKMAIA